MNIYYEFIGYVGSVFTNENGVEIEYETIKDNLYKLDGRKGKLVYLGYTSVYEQWYSGGYKNYGFVFQDDLSIISLNTSGKTILVSESNTITNNTCDKIFEKASKID